VKVGRPEGPRAVLPRPSFVGKRQRLWWQQEDESGGEKGWRVKGPRRANRRRARGTARAVRLASSPQRAIAVCLWRQRQPEEQRALALWCSLLVVVGCFSSLAARSLVSCPRVPEANATSIATAIAIATTTRRRLSSTLQLCFVASVSSRPSSSIRHRQLLCLPHRYVVLVHLRLGYRATHRSALV